MKVFCAFSEVLLSANIRHCIYVCQYNQMMKLDLSLMGSCSEKNTPWSIEICSFNQITAFLFMESREILYSNNRRITKVD